jgi:Protein of unknown function (DUF3631)
MLKTLDIIPNTIKLPDGKQPNGYKRSQFDDAFARYPPQAPGSSVQGSPSSPTPAKPGASDQAQSSPRGASGEVQNRRNPQKNKGLGEDGELLEPYVETYGDNDGVDYARRAFETAHVAGAPLNRRPLARCLDRLGRGNG